MPTSFLGKCLTLKACEIVHKNCEIKNNCKSAVVTVVTIFTCPMRIVLVYGESEGRFSLTHLSQRDGSP